MARDAIALFLDIASDSFDVRIEPLLPGDLQKKVVEFVESGAKPRCYSVRRQSQALRSRPIWFKGRT